MLNYIKAELWKLSQRPALFVLGGVLFLLMALYASMMSAGEFYNLAAAGGITSGAGLLFVPLLVLLVDDGTLDTLKNETAFGMSRTRIYLGKLAAVLLAGLGLCAVLLAFYLGGGWVLLDHSRPDQEKINLAVLGFSLLGAVPIWCGTAGFCHMAALAVRSTSVWLSGYYIFFFFGQPVLLVFLAALLGGEPSAWIADVAAVILMPFLLLTPDFLSGWLTWEYQLWCWAVGLGWLAVSSGAGLFLLRRKNIR